MLNNISMFFKPLIKKELMVGSIVIISIFGMLLSLYLTSTGQESTRYIFAILLAQLASSIFFPVTIGVLYDKIRGKKDGDAIWKVFYEFNDGGIIRIYKSRDEETGKDALRERFEKYKSDEEIKFIGVSLREFFVPGNPFYDVIQNLIFNKKNIKIKALLCDPKSVEAKNRGEIENPGDEEAQITKQIEISKEVIDNYATDDNSIEYKFYTEAPYCTAVLFSDQCFYIPNILIRSRPILPMIVFRKNSKAFNHLNEYFKNIWELDS